MAEEPAQTETVPLVGSPRPEGGSFPAPLHRGAAVGRYVILDPVGEGGMGVVHSAYDPELDRKVALKLLRPDRAAGEAARLRLLREAQAIARLSHPHVVTVHDAGTFGNQVFIAMEFVEGTTLRQWLRTARRPWREVVARFVLAGRGLAAAHAAGLVHRDFKPDNVLLGDDGRVRVADFGLARPAGEEESGEDGTGSGSLLASPLTEWGVAVGTPVYMAPEQLRGGRADARSDQYSFCVALWEALYGRRPGGEEPEPAGTEVPGWLRQVLQRGLATDPAARYPSMDELLRDLERDPGTARRRWLLAAVLVVLGGAAFAGLGYVQARSGQLCGGAEEKLAGLWDAQRKRAVHQAFLATGLPYAAETWTRVEGTLERYAADWSALHRRACEATRMRGEQSEDLLDRRILCLDQRLGEMKALVDLFGRADAQVVGKAAAAAAGLGDLAACADGPSLAGREPLPKDPALRSRIAAVQTGLAAAKALQAAGKFREALPHAAGAERQTAILAYQPLHGQALYQVAELRENLGDFEAAEDFYYQALAAAEEGRDDLLRAGCWKKLVYTVGYRQARFDEAHRLARQGQAVLRRIGGNPLLESALLSSQASILTLQGKHREALAVYERALELEQRGGPHPQEYVLISNLGMLHSFLGDRERALAQYQRALDLAVKEIGPGHPVTASLRYNIGDALTALGRTAEARNHLLRSLADREKALGPEHADVAESLNALGANWIEDERPENALPYLERARKIYGRKEHGSLYSALCHSLLGECLRRLDRPDEARAQFAASLEEFERIAGPESGYLAAPLGGLAELLLDQGQPEAALPLLERSRKKLEAHPVFPNWVAANDFGLARALWEAGGDRQRALALARRARQVYVSDPGAKRELAEVDTWLARHGREDKPLV